MRLRIVTRGSKLAMWQTSFVAAELHRLHPDLEIEAVEIRTRGDRITDRPLPEVGGKGLFTEELEAALRDGRADLAVHSLKDLPTRLEEDLALACVTRREDPRDALVATGPMRFDSIPGDAVIGTGSLRRQAQILARHPGLKIRDLRGNVPTRIRKLDDGDYDAIVLALAGLRRLGLEDRVTQILEPADMLPAVGQGALGIETRGGDERILGLLAPLEDASTRAAVTAERALLHRLEGGCHVPIGALGEVEDDRVRLEALVAATDGTRVIRGTRAGPIAQAEALGRDLAEDLLAQGAREILSEKTS
jgi:hydroxymethylbilane synthase